MMLIQIVYVLQFESDVNETKYVGVNNEFIKIYRFFRIIVLFRFQVDRFYFKKKFFFINIFFYRKYIEVIIEFFMVDVNRI